MRKLIPFLILALPFNALAALSNADRTALPVKNYLRNGGAELSLSGVSATPAATIVTGTGNVDDGGAAFAWDSASAGQIFSIEGVTVTSGGGLSGRDTVLSCAFKAASGTATHTLCLYDGTAETCQAIVSDTAKFVRTSVIHPAPTSGTLTARVKSVASNEPSVTVDSCRLERLDESRMFQVAQSRLVAHAQIPGTANCTWIRTNTALGAFNTDADCPGPTVQVDGGVCQVQTTDTDLPKITCNNAPAGNYVVTAGFTSSYTVTTALIQYGLSDGTNTRGATAWRAGNGSDLQAMSVTGAWSYSTSGNRTWEVYGAADSGQLEITNTDSSRNLTFTIWYTPSSSQTGLTLDQFGTAWTGYQTNTTGWAVAGTSYANCNAGSPTLVEQINRNFGTVSNAAASDCGITFTPKKSSVYFVVAELGVLASTAMYGSVQMVDGSNNVLDPGRALHIPSNNFSAISSSSLISGVGGTPFTIRFRLAASTGTFQIFGPVITGQSAIKWTIYDLTSFGAVSLRGVPTSSGDAERVERAKVTCSGSSAIVNQSGAWLASVGNISGGTCAYTIASGVFSGEPVCHFQEIAGAGAFYFHTAAATPTSLSIRGVTDSGANITSATGYLLCMGPR